MEFKVLNRDNFLIYAMSNYTNADCVGMEEFLEDISKIKYTKRLLKRYNRTGKLRTILLLNHVMVLGNVFGRRTAAQMLFFKLETDLHSALKTVLMYLNYIEDEEIINGASVGSVLMDEKLAHILRQL